MPKSIVKMIEKKVPCVSIRKNFRSAPYYKVQELTDYCAQALAYQDFDAFVVAVNKGANPYLENRYRICPFFYLLESGYYDQIEYALDNLGLNPNHVDGRGIPALIYATQINSYSAAYALLEYGANPNIKDSDGNTALMVAAKNGFNKVLNLLLAEQHNLNDVNSDCNSPLMLSVIGKKYQSFKRLMSENPFVNYENRDGKTVFDLADEANGLSGFLIRRYLKRKPMK